MKITVIDIALLTCITVLSGLVSWTIKDAEHIPVSYIKSCNCDVESRFLVSPGQCLATPPGAN